MSGNFVLNLILSASLNQVWSMLNSLQISVHGPMFSKLKFPANAMMFNQYLSYIANFDLINTAENIDPYFYYFPEDEAFSINFAQCGYEA